MGKKLNLDNPREFNEKIHWIKCYYRPPILTQLVDKYEVRAYVEQQIGKRYLNPIVGVYKKCSDIDFNALPNRFVAKVVQGSGYNFIVKDKSKLDKKLFEKKVNKWLRTNYYYRSGQEWAYKNVIPKVMIEHYMEEKDKDVLNDYKIFCFNGSPKFIQIDIDRGSNNLRCFYDLQWKKLPFEKGRSKMYRGHVEKPTNLEEMVTLAKKLSKPFPFVRVDFYSVNGKTIFGEMTFYPGGGCTEFRPDKYNIIFGEWLQLPKIPEGKKYIDTL